MSSDRETVGRAASWLSAVAALCSPLALTGCGGGVPGDAVATVDGEPIERQSLDHWMTIEAKSGGGSNATVPRPPDYANCTISVADAEVERAFEEQRERSFPNEGDLERFLKTSGQTQQDVLMRARFDLLWNKIRDQVTKGEERVTDEQVNAYYRDNRERFAQPERRDLRVVLARSRAAANAAMDKLAAGRSWTAVARKYSIDKATKAQGGKLDDVVRGQQEPPLDKAIFRAPRSAVRGPVKTRFGYCVFAVASIDPPSRQTFKQAKPTIAQLVAAETEQKTLDGLIESFRRKWRERTECRKGFLTPYCTIGPQPPTTERRG